MASVAEGHRGSREVIHSEYKGLLFTQYKHTTNAVKLDKHQVTSQGPADTCRPGWLLHSLVWIQYAQGMQPPVRKESAICAQILKDRKKEKQNKNDSTQMMLYERVQRLWQHHRHKSDFAASNEQVWDQRSVQRNTGTVQNACGTKVTTRNFRY